MSKSELEIGIEATYQQALKSLGEGGIPIGSCILVDGLVVASGHNQRVQCGSNIRHGETDCLEQCGHNVDFKRATMFSSLTPCMMCTGAIILFGIPRVVVLDNENTSDFETDLDLLRKHDVEVVVVNHAASIKLNREYQNDPMTRKVWLGDVGK